MAPPVVVAHRSDLMPESLAGRQFYKMSGSGNDFVVFDVTDKGAGNLEAAGTIRALAARGTGVGADGVVFLEKVAEGRVAMRYYNADGTVAALCGNASLCSASLAVELGMTKPAGFILDTAAGSLKVRIRDGLPEIDLEPVTEVSPDALEVTRGEGEARIGFAKVGVPHLTLAVADLEAVDVAARGLELRHHPSLREGANVNFVVPGAAGTWVYRAYERGVEAETLACGTGAVATAILLASWGKAADEVELTTRSGLPLTVRLRRAGSAWHPSLRGQGRLVFRGTLGEGS